MELFTIFCTITALFLLTAIGSVFRNKQQSTDQDITYENSKKLVRTQYVILEGIDRLIPNTPQNIETKTLIKKQLEYLEKIQNGKG